MVVAKLILLLSSLSMTPAPPAEPVFVQGDRCALTGPLEIAVRERERPVSVAKGTSLEVTTSDLRFSQVRAGQVTGMVENRALALVCRIERPACMVSAPLALRGVGKPKHQGKLFRLQRGGTLLVLQHDAAQAKVRVGTVDAEVELPALLAACPALNKALAPPAAPPKKPDEP